MYMRTYVRTQVNYIRTLHMSVCMYVRTPAHHSMCVFRFLVDVSATDLRTSLLGPPSPYLRALVKNVDSELEPSTAAEQRKVDPCSLTTNPSWKGVVSARSCEGSGACRLKGQSRKEGA